MSRLSGIVSVALFSQMSAQQSCLDLDLTLRSRRCLIKRALVLKSHLHTLHIDSAPTILELLKSADPPCGGLKGCETERPVPVPPCSPPVETSFSPKNVGIRSFPFVSVGFRWFPFVSVRFRWFPLVSVGFRSIPYVSVFGSQVVFNLQIDFKST